MKLSSLKQQIEELDAKATKGPWYVEDDGEFIATKKRGISFDIALVPEYLRQGEHANSDRDAELMALSRTAMPELLRRLLVAEEAVGDTINYSFYDSPDDQLPEKAKVLLTKLHAALATIRGEEE